MRRRVGVLVALGVSLALGGLGGCGGSEGFSDSELSDAAGLKNGFVGGDQFCEVSKLLNDSAEIEQASAKKGTPIITSANGNVGVTVVPPFPNDCAGTVRKGLNKLDPKPKEEKDQG